MKKIFCYIGIIFLLFLTFLPPLLRIFLPNQIEEQEEEKKEQVILSCSSEKYIINTSYENNKIRMIIMKQLKESNLSREGEDLNHLDEENTAEETPSLELDQAFSDLKNKSNVTYNVLEDGEVLALDFSISDYAKLNLTNFTKKIEEQKEYYENQNLSCIIRK